jgi:hypothetical protein
MRLTLAQILFIGAAAVLALRPVVSVAAPDQADDLYVLCVTGSGPWCDDSTEYPMGRTRFTASLSRRQSRADLMARGLVPIASTIR